MDPLTSALKFRSVCRRNRRACAFVSENIANARSTGDAPGADPFPPQDESACREVDPGKRRVPRRGRTPRATDDSDFNIEFDPGNPPPTKRAW